MSEKPTSELERADAGEAAEIERRGTRRGLLSVANRLLGRGSTFTTSSLLTAVAVVIAISLNWVLGWIGLIEFTWRIFAATTIVTILTGFPIILYSQLIIRELKTSRQMLRKMTERLAWAFHNAERVSDAKSHFLANMSHELRTPLNAVIGFSDILRHQRFGPIGSDRYLDYAKDINESGVHLLSIINDILDLAKIEAGHATAEDENEFDADTVVESATRMTRPLADRQGVYLRMNASNAGVVLTGVERMVRQVLINVLSNAIKFTPRDGTVSVLTELRSNGNFVISIVDTGVGMSHDDVKIALTPFGQAKNDLTRRHQGTGLGLPLAKAMMEMHGGRLLVRSQPGEGTTIILVFPSMRVGIAAPEQVEQPVAHAS